MLVSEKIAMAAHLHVLLRRKTGRVTDTEWMATNVEYAMEIVRFARAKAKEDGHPDLAEWADKLERAMLEPSKAAGKPLAQVALQALREHRPDATQPVAPVAEPAATGFENSTQHGESGFFDSTFEPGGAKRKIDPNAPRYVGGIR